MKVSSFIITQILSATSALAYPSRHDMRALHSRTVKTPASNPASIITGDNQSLNSTNWAGAILTAPSSATFTSVSAQFTVPSLKVVGGETGSSYVWVGIDGYSDKQAILQTGIDLTVDENNESTYFAWYEWYPNDPEIFDSITISAGDVISLAVDATSPSAGTATIKNLSNGNTGSASLTAPSSSANLVGQNAEWILEDYYVGATPVHSDNWGTLTFSDATAGLSNGESVGVTDAAIMNIAQSSEDMTSVTTPSDSEVVITYI